MSGGKLLITLLKISVKIFGNVKMSVTLVDGDNPFTHFLPHYPIHFSPQFTTTYGHYAILMTTFSPL